ncbi:MAG: Trk system potassium transporter TrkA [Chitinivibrionales bacterium]
MNIIIVGAGTVGYSLAAHLSSLNHHISVIEHNAALSKEINAKLDVFTVTGPGASPQALLDAGIANADMVIAVTPRDDTNLLVCGFAKQYGVIKRIARIKNSEYTQAESRISLQELGVTHVIEPEKEVVRSILQYIELPGVTKTANFQSDNVYLRGFRITEDMPLTNKTLSEIRQIPDVGNLLIVLIIRDGKSVLPTGDERVLPGDDIVAIMASESLDSFRKLLNRPPSKLKKVVVSGDTLTAIYLARELRPFADRIILVDPDEHHGLFAASQLNGVEVLHGDCTNIEMLQEVHVENTPFFIAAGKDTEDNIMSCLLAKAEGAKEVIAISNNQKHVDLFQSLGLDHIINPHSITSQSIIANVLKVPIGALLHLKDVNVEVTRLIAEHNSRVVDKPLSQLDKLFRKSVIIGSVMREDRVIIPSGDTIIQPGDEVLVLCNSRKINSVSKFFKSGLGFA